MSAIEEVKSRLDIVDVVGEHVALQRAGRNFRALCPFHNERTPSFHVSPERQTWHCFGACGTGGDVFSFVMKRENVEFPEALRILAARAGVQLEERRRDPRVDEREQRLLQANEAAAAYFHNALVHGRPAEGARAYLIQRGVDMETAEAFQLGFAPETWDSLKSHLIERGFTEEELLAAGLLVEGERGGYDRFRGRLMFPIRDERGRVAGFGGRALASGEQAGAKYVNTPQTPMFDKGALLYALDRAKEAVRREQRAIVVEGYMDAIAAHQHGMTNVVASMGTALTERQIRALERMRATILLALDADAAGIEATLRALQEAEAAGAIRAGPEAVHPSEMDEERFIEKARDWSRNALRRAATNFYVVPLAGKDPDEMIRNDRAAWEQAVANAKPFTDHVFDVVAGRKDLRQVAQRAELVRELLPVVSLIEEPVYRAHYIQRLARLAQVGEDAVRGELRKQPARRAQPQAAAAETLPPAPCDAAEEFCLGLLLHNIQLRNEGLALSDELFAFGEHRAIFAAWRDAPDSDTLREVLDQDLASHLDRILERDLPILEGEHLREALQDCVRRIEFRRLTQAKRASAAALTEPDVQPYMSQAVQEALVLQTAQAGASPEAATPATDLALNLIEDEELGRRLHRLTPALQHTEDGVSSPRGEDEP
jgi:DNA primase